MRALILAAGRGERMGELTRSIPKPLLRVGEHYLIEYALANLKHAGIHEIVINVFYQAEQIKQALGTGERYGVHIAYSEEQERLDVGGGIVQAQALLGDEPFIAVSADVITDYPLASLPQKLTGLAHLVMVQNPVFHPEGDFGLCQNILDLEVQPRLTFGSVGIYQPELFCHHPAGFLRWSDIMLPAIQAGQVTGELFKGQWYNVGTPADLADVNQRAREDSNLRPLASETNTLSN